MNGMSRSTSDRLLPKGRNGDYGDGSPDHSPLKSLEYSE